MSEILECQNCGEEFYGSRLKMYCSDECKRSVQNSRRARVLEKGETGSYDASNIKIMPYSNNLWSSSVSLANIYCKPIGFIQRGLEACRLARVEQSYFIKRYLDDDKSVPLNSEVNIISRELQISMSHNR